MELSKKTLDDLAFGHIGGNIDSITFTSILQFAFHSLTTKSTPQSDDKQFTQLFGVDSIPSPSKSNDSSQLTNNTKFQFYTAVLSFITEISRFDLSTAEIKSTLEDKFDEQRVKEFLQFHSENVAAIRFQLSLLGVNFSQLIDFHWRLDYNVHSHALEDMREQNYILSFVLLDPTTRKQSTITCQADLAQMNELLGHVKDALSKRA